jgi:hypothetical protein
MSKNMSTCKFFCILIYFIIGTAGFNARNIFLASDSHIDGKPIRLFCCRLRGGLADKSILPSAMDDLAVNAEAPFYPSVFDDDDLESDDRYTVAATNRILEKGSAESEEADEDAGV